MTRAGDSGYIYDANGNLVEKNSKQGTVKYNYTEDNRLKGVYYSDGQEVEYDYDALGRKVFRTSTSYDLNYLKSHVNNGNGNGRWNAIDNGNGAKVGLHKQLDGALSTDTTHYLYNGTTSDVLKEYGPEGQPLAEYYWANGQVGSRKMFGFHGDKTSGWAGNIRTRGGLLYYNYDATGHAIGVDDRVGDTVMNYRYDAFGNLFTDMPAPYNATGYTGKNYDPVAGLMDYSARWYSPSVGRFLTEDSVIGDLSNPQSLNRYAYVMNNPINMVDPSGHVPEWVRNQQDYSLQYDQGGTTYVELWNYIAGSYQKQTSPTSLVDTIQTNKYYQQTYQQTVTESWDYDYTKYFIINDIPKELPQFDDIMTFSETNVLEWYNVITAKELMEQNAGEIASYGAPPYARVVYSSSTLDGEPFSSDMIYGGQRAAQQYNEMMRQIAAHTKQKQSKVEPDYYKDVIELTPEEQMMILESPYASPIDKAKVELRMAYDSILITKIPKAVEVVNSASGVLESKLKQAISNFKGTGESKLISNKFPNESLPPNGKKIDFTIEDGMIKGLNGQRNVDFVINNNGKLNIGNKHHYLGNAQDVKAAGQLKLDGQGRIRRIDNLSGHYRPTVDEAMNYPELFRQNGLNIKNSWLELYGIKVDESGFVESINKAVSKKIK